MRFRDEKKIKEILVEALEEIKGNDKLKDLFNAELLEGELYYHSIEVARIATQLMLILNYHQQDMIETAIGAILHDIGKLYVPKEILYKTSELTTEEFKIIKKHPVDGYNALRGTNLSEQSLNVVRSHHEKLDGNGYPDGIIDIPENVQLVTVADIYSAMTERRCYHSPISTVKALREIDNSGLKQEVVDALYDSIID